jgi:Domain of unknown function DUF11/GEVED domain/Secretion system C-terminal sorting domain/CARDB
MKQFLLFLQLSLCVSVLTAQVNYNANTTVTPYAQGFHLAANNGYFPGWINEQVADYSIGNTALNIPGAGMRAMRVGFNEEIAELFGYDILDGLFSHYARLGAEEHTMILGYPVDWHRDPATYCGDPNKRSVMFKGMYLPVWDGGLNGTPYNDDNLLAVYTYKMVSRYKDNIRFWEIWNEPGFDLTFSKGWLPPNQPGNWWTQDPLPCDIVLYAPVEHYVRTLRVSYDIIKTLDPDSYVTASGLGYPSFLDAVLRNTDNPVDGSVTAQYPLTGGAYFDAVGFHSYPHFDGSVRYYDFNLNQMVDARHSDGAADGTIRVWQTFEQVLNTRGYDGSSFPRKVKLITEGNIPRKAFDVGTANESLGGTEVQRNYGMKNMVRLMQNGFAQYDQYQLFENTTFSAAAQAYDIMGLYEKPTGLGILPPRTEHAIGLNTTSRLLYRTNYDATRTAAMQLPTNVGGAAFLNPNGKYVYTLWAKTLTDRSESASANYSFPAALGVTGLTRRNWDFGQTNSSVASPSANITLSSAPTFFTDDTAWPPAIANNPATKVDLAISLSASPANPTAGSNYTWSLTITNSSANNATGVEVGNFMEFSKQFILDRITYVSHAAPAGTSYDQLNGRWTIGSIPAGQSRTITVTTRAVHGGIYKTFAQVTKCDQLDVDSSPQNGQAIKTPFEDDETFFIVNNNGFIDTKADWVIEATNYPASAATGTTIPLNFMLRNNGRLGGAATTTTIYLSTDAQFSANDQFLSFQTAPAMPAFGYNLHNTTLTLPSGLANGTYYLLFSADFAGAVDEADENNVFARIIQITGGGTPTCSINAVVSGATCNNAGTPTNAADDTWTFSLNVTGANTGAGWTATVAGQTVTGTYGTPKSVSGGLINAGTRVFAVGDQTNTACITQVSAVPPAPCSSAPGCQISASIGNLQCNNAGTPTIGADDTYTYTLFVTGTNNGSGWTANIAGQTVTGAYGVLVPVSGGLITNGSTNGVVVDNQNASCTSPVQISPPPFCSTNAGGVCASKGDAPWEEWISSVQVGTGAPQVSDKAQYTDYTSKVFTVQNGSAVSLTAQYSYTTRDEYWRIWIDLNGDNDFTDAGEQVFEGIGTAPPSAINATKVTTGSVVIPAGTPTANRRMRVAMKRGGFPTSCETIPFGEVEDYTVAVSAGTGCSLSAVVSGAVCNNAGTPNNAADDTWTFNLTVTGTGTGTGWSSSVAGQVVTGTYGVAKSVNGGLISAGNRTFAVGDQTNASCTTSVTAVPPPVCSTGPTCQISALVSGMSCNNAGTTTTATDDTYSYSMTVTGTNTGTGWSANIGGTTVTGTYGVPRGITGGLISGGVRNFNIVDNQNVSCTTPVTVTPPATCSEPNPNGYCVAKGELPWEEWISEVRVGTNFQASSKSQYSDFTSKVFAVQNGTVISLTTQYSWLTYDAYYRVWIDLNNDGDFIDVGEQVLESIVSAPIAGANVTKTATGTINIPSGTPSANYRMRVAMKRGAFPSACEAIPRGEVEDYTAAVSGGGTPTCAINAAVSNVVCNNNNTPTNPADDTYSFNVTVSGNNTGTSTAWQVLGANGFSGTYGIAKTVSGLAISGGTVNFTAQDAANSGCNTNFSVTPPAPCSGGNPGTYCASKGEFPWEDWLSNVQIGTQTRPSSKAQYTDNTTSAALTVSNATPITLTASYSYFTFDEYCTVWIDLNSDGDFTDAGEQVYQGILVKPAAAVGATKTLNGTITLPVGATGTRRMRVSMKRGAYATSCETFTNGEVEDYTVNIVATILQSGKDRIEVEITKTTLAPNPAMDFVTLYFADALETEAQVRILNQLGLNLRNNITVPAGSEQIEIPLTGLPPGVYFLDVRQEGKRGRVMNLVVGE